MSRRPKRIDPGESANCTRATKKITTVDSTLFREFVSIAVVGALLAVIMTDAVVGMSSGFAPTSEVGYMLAGVGADDR